MASLAHFFHAFRGLVVALVVLVAGASVSAPGLAGLSLDGAGLGLSACATASSGTGVAWRESSRRASVESETAEVAETDAEQADALGEAPGAPWVHGTPPGFTSPARPAQRFIASVSLAAPHFEASRTRGPPLA